MDKPPVTTQTTATSSSSTTTQETGAHRSCSACRKRMSQQKYDRHSVCISCRSINCDLNQRCDECSSWTSEEMDLYLKHRKTLESKGKKKESKAPTQPQSPKVTVDIDMIKSLEDRLNKKFATFFEHKLDMIDEMIGGRLTNLLSAPSQVPNPAPQGVPGGSSIARGSIEPQVDKTPGMVPVSSFCPPPHYAGNLFDSNALASSGRVAGVGSDHLQGRGSGTLINLHSGMNVGVNAGDKITPSSSAPSDYLFDPFSTSSSVPRTIPFSSSPFSSASSFSVSSMMTSAASSSIYSFPSPSPDNPPNSSASFNLADYNGGILGLSQAYQRFARACFVSNMGFAKFTQVVFSDRTDLMQDLLKDCQNGPSVFWDSLKLAVSPGVSRSAAFPPIAVSRGSQGLSGFGFVPSCSVSVSQGSVVPSGNLASSQAHLPFFLTPFSHSAGSLLSSSSSFNPVSSSIDSVSHRPWLLGADAGGNPPVSVDTGRPVPSIIPVVPASVSQVVNPQVVNPPVLDLGRPVQQPPVSFAVTQAPIFPPSSVAVTVAPSPFHTPQAPQRFVPPVPHPARSSAAPFLPPFTPAAPVPSVPRPVRDDDDLHDFFPPEDPPSDTDVKVNTRYYRQMIEFIVGLFPQAKGMPTSSEFRSLFEHFYSVQSDSLPPVSKLNWFDRVLCCLQEADSKLASFISDRKSDTSVFLPYKSLYSVADNISKARPLPLNESLESVLTRVPQASRLASITLKELAILESLFRAQVETLSHNMWVLTGLIAFLKNDGFVPSDPLLFNQLVSSLSMGLAHSTNSSASGTSFAVTKRRESYLSHLPPSFSDVSKRTLLKAPANLASSLFRDSDVAAAIESANMASSFKSQQAIIDVASKGHSSPSRERSPSRSPKYSRSGSRQNSPKRVRFADSKSPPSSVKKNFHK